MCKKRCKKTKKYLKDVKKDVYYWYQQKGNSMKYRELAELMKSAGWVFERNGKGSHKIWRKDKQIIPIPDHGSKEINPGLVKAIIKQAGIR